MMELPTYICHLLDLGVTRVRERGGVAVGLGEGGGEALGIGERERRRGAVARVSRERDEMIRMLRVSFGEVKRYIYRVSFGEVRVVTRWYVINNIIIHLELKELASQAVKSLAFYTRGREFDPCC